MHPSSPNPQAPHTSGQSNGTTPLEARKMQSVSQEDHATIRFLNDAQHISEMAIVERLKPEAIAVFGKIRYLPEYSRSFLLLNSTVIQLGPGSMVYLTQKRNPFLCHVNSLGLNLTAYAGAVVQHEKGAFSVSVFSRPTLHNLRHKRTFSVSPALILANVHDNFLDFRYFGLWSRLRHSFPSLEHRDTLFGADLHLLGSTFSLYRKIQHQDDHTSTVFRVKRRMGVPEAMAGYCVIDENGFFPPMYNLQRWWFYSSLWDFKVAVGKPSGLDYQLLSSTQLMLRRRGDRVVSLRGSAALGLSNRQGIDLGAKNIAGCYSFCKSPEKADFSVQLMGQLAVSTWLNLRELVSGPFVHYTADRRGREWRSQVNFGIKTTLFASPNFFADVLLNLSDTPDRHALVLKLRTTD